MSGTRKGIRRSGALLRYTVAVLVLLLGGVPPVAAGAAPVSKVPANPQVIDVAGDANHLNDQGTSEGGGTGGAWIPSAARVGDIAVGNVDPAADVLGLWFDHDDTLLTASIWIAAEPKSRTSLLYRVFASPGEGPRAMDQRGCFWFFVHLRGAQVQTHFGQASARVEEVCYTGTRARAEAGVETLEDGSSIVQISVKRAALDPAFGDGARLERPFVQVRHWISTPFVAEGYPAGQLDSTPRGRSYILRRR